MGKSLTWIAVLFFSVTLTLGLTAMHTGYSFSSIFDTHFVTLKLEGSRLTVP
jgi:hypothetical protein